MEGQTTCLRLVAASRRMARWTERPSRGTPLSPARTPTRSSSFSSESRGSLCTVAWEMPLSSTCCCTRPSTLRFHRRRRQATTCRCADIPSSPMCNFDVTHPIVSGHIARKICCGPSRHLCTHRCVALMLAILSSLHPPLCYFDMGSGRSHCGLVVTNGGRVEGI
jgi:hypothetical protein